MGREPERWPGWPTWISLGQHTFEVTYDGDHQQYYGDYVDATATVNGTEVQVRGHNVHEALAGLAREINQRLRLTETEFLAAWRFESAKVRS